MRYECERVRTLVRDAIKRFLREEQHFESKFSIDAFIGVDVAGMGMFYVTLNEAFDAGTCGSEDESPGTSDQTAKSSRKRRHYMCSNDADTSTQFECIGNKNRTPGLLTRLKSGGPELIDMSDCQPLHGAAIKQEFAGQRLECDESNSNSDVFSLENFNQLGNVTVKLDRTDKKSEVEAGPCDNDSSDGEDENRNPQVAEDNVKTNEAMSPHQQGTSAADPRLALQFWSDSLSDEIKQAMIPPKNITKASGTCHMNDCKGSFQTSMRRHWEEVHAPYFRARQCPITTCRQWLSRDFGRHLTKVHKLFSSDVSELLSKKLVQRWFTRQAWETTKSIRRRMKHWTGIELTDEMIVSEIAKRRTNMSTRGRPEDP